MEQILVAVAVRAATGVGLAAVQRLEARPLPVLWPRRMLELASVQPGEQSWLLALEQRYWQCSAGLTKTIECVRLRSI